MINVLIADDDHNAREGLSEMLDWSALGATLVAAVEDGEKVIELLKQRSDIDLIILDICMPHMDGLAVSKYVRDNSLNTDIILLSAHAEFEYAREALRYGVRDYIIKPINRAKLNLLITAIEDVSRQNRHSSKRNRMGDTAGIQQGIITAFEGKNSDAAQELLDSGYSAETTGIASFREYCVSLLNHMHEYLKAKGSDTGICDRSVKLLRDVTDINTMKTLFMETFKALVTLESSDSGKAVSGVVIIAKEYIHNNITSSELHSSAVASHLKLSVDHLSRLFKAAGEESLSDYIIKAKIDKAKEIIANSSDSIRQVALTLGYSDPGYFVRVFKKKTGITPTEYRNRAREAPG